MKQNPPTGECAAVIFDARADRWLAFRRVRAAHSAYRVADVLPALRQVEQEVARGQWAVGFLAYEAAPAFDPALVVKPSSGMPLLWFGIFDEPDSGAPLDFSESQPRYDLRWQPTVDRDAYRQAIARIKRLIQDGDTYQVNFTLRLRAAFPHAPWPLFVRLADAQRARYCAFLDTPEWAICSASPEMFFEWQGLELLSRPMKGTAPRGLWLDDDRARAAELKASLKNRAENVMIVDMVRNDLGRIAALGSVKVTSLFDLERYPTVWQLTSTVRCTTHAGIVAIFKALFPASSITGAPKARTMQIITELETTPRQVYTGAIGFIAPQRRAQFNVAIRTVLVDKQTGMAEYGTGGGIVWDSTAADEFEEALAKTRILTRRTPLFSLLETMRWTPEAGVFLLDRHVRRLQDSADYFGRRVELDAIQRLLEATTAALAPVPHRLRLLVPEQDAPTLEAAPLRALADPYRIRLAERPVDAQNPFLYHKTTVREVYDQALRDHPGYDDVLLWNQQGELTETCIANVMVELDGEWFTPPLRCGLLAGTYRAWLLEQGRVKERVIRVEELGQNPAIQLMNSVRGEWQAALTPSV
ncbi:MAG: aminodeoxychorismate synthase component I [Gammaproteobacteria bacterium]